MSKYVPTTHFRFVEREVYDTPTTAHRARILQQGWVREHIGGFIEWRDVPVEQEAPVPINGPMAPCFYP